MSATTRTPRSKDPARRPLTAVEAAEAVVRHEIASHSGGSWPYSQKVLDGICEALNPYDAAIVVRLGPGLPPVVVTIHGDIPELAGVRGLGHVDVQDAEGDTDE